MMHGTHNVKFRLTLIREMLAQTGYESRPPMPVRRPSQASTNIGRLDTCHSKHWPSRNPTKRWCCVCFVRGVTRKVMFRCVKCDVALCVDRNCLADYHTKDSLQDSFSSVPCTKSWSLDHNVSKRTWIFTSSLETYLLRHSIFKAYWAMSVSVPKKCFLFHRFILLSSRNIQVFRKASTKFKIPRRINRRAGTYRWDLIRHL